MKPLLKKNRWKEQTSKESKKGVVGHLTGNYTGTQSFTTTLSYSLAKKTLGTYIEFFGFVQNIGKSKLFNP